MLKTITLLIFFLKCTVFFSQNKIESPLDSVNKYYSISETILIPENRVKFLNKAFFYAKKLKNDSLLINVSSLLAYDNVMLDNKIGFKEANSVLFNVYENKKNRTAFGLYNRNKGWYFENNAQIDSAYYYYNKAKVIFKSSKTKDLKNIYYYLLDLNFIIKDYLGVEELAIEIIKNDAFKNEYEFLADTYGFLGVISSKFGDYNNAIKYYIRVEEIVKKIENKKIREISKIDNINNIGSLYTEQGKYNKALPYFTKALKIDSNLKDNDIETYITLLANKGGTELKIGKNNNGLVNLNKALKIAKELKDYYTQIFSLLELASFYKKEKKLINVSSM